MSSCPCLYLIQREETLSEKSMEACFLNSRDSQRTLVCPIGNRKWVQTLHWFEPTTSPTLTPIFSTFFPLSIVSAKILVPDQSFYDITFLYKS